MIQIFSETDPSFSPISQDICTKIALTVLNSHQIKNGEITFIFGSDKLVSKLKKEFFHVDQLTDVIAFRLNEYEEADVEGEVYISLQRTKENAKIYSEPFKRELARLIIHGTLHLLNYDDQTEKEKKEMQQLEDTYLEQIDWKGLLH